MFKISVIIPVYNAERYLKKCLDSLLEQTFQDYEVIIINDGSKDSSGEICEEYKKLNSKIQVIHQENQGVSKARNTAIEKAQGEWLFFLDADDELFKNSLETLYSHTKGVDIVIGECVVYSTEGRVIFTPPKTFIEHLDKNSTFKLLYRPYFIYQGYLCNKLYKRTILTDNNIRFNEKISFGEDKLMIVEYMSHCKNSTYTSQPVYKYYRREESAMNSINISFNRKYISSFHAEVESCNYISTVKDIKKEIREYAQECIVNAYFAITSHMKRFSVKEDGTIKELKSIMYNKVPKLQYCKYSIKHHYATIKNCIINCIRTLLQKISFLHR